MNRLSLVSPLMPLAACLGISACLPAAEAPPRSDFHVERVEVRHEAAMTSADSLAPGEDEALADFLARNRSPDARIRVDALGPSAATEQATVLAALRRGGGIAAPGMLAAGPSDRVVVVVTRDVYVSAACAAGAVPMPDGLRPLGCSNALNLSAMIDAPQDLAHGRTPGPAPAGPIGRAALRYLKEGGEATLSPAASDDSSAAASGAATTTGN